MTISFKREDWKKKKSGIGINNYTCLNTILYADNQVLI